jgi:hypothetical protein
MRAQAGVGRTANVGLDDRRVDRNRRERSTLRSTASANNSAFSSSSNSGPSRFLSFINVDGSGTRPSSAVRQKRRQVNESATSLQSVS